MRSVPIVLAAALALAGALPSMLAGPAHAVFDPPSVLENEADYLKALTMIEAGAFGPALGMLEGLSTDYPDVAEVHSLIGFSLRKLGRMDEALVAYARALSLDPEHLGANAYLGTFFVETGRLEFARARLRRLETLCGADCEETRALAAVITAAEGR